MLELPDEDPEPEAVEEGDVVESPGRGRRWSRRLARRARPHRTRPGLWSGGRLRPGLLLHA
uniref:Uncharacterized protein n=1 Tax=Janibacter limosus TaxID=53458 RepID=A0AC61U7N1_9MICO|nr:hypothetical protein [Janibacter limosus]